MQQAGLKSLWVGPAREMQELGCTWMLQQGATVDVACPRRICLPQHTSIEHQLALCV